MNTKWVGLVAVAAAFVSVSGCRHQRAEEASPVVTVDVAPVLLSRIQRTIRAQGLIYPRQQAAIVPKVSAPIKKAYVQRGATVRAGQTLVELENQDLAAAAAFISWSRAKPRRSLRRFCAVAYCVRAWLKLTCASLTSLAAMAPS